jgi:hypothetical protein
MRSLKSSDLILSPSVSPILPHKKLFWPILSWKAILFVVYIALLFALSFFWSYIATFTDRQSGIMGNGNLFGEFLSYFTDGLSESLSPLLTINLLFVIFCSWSYYSDSYQHLSFIHLMDSNCFPPALRPLDCLFLFGRNPIFGLFLPRELGE